MSEITAKDLRGNEPEELRNTIRKLQEDLFKHRMKRVTNQLENTMLLRHARRDIARVNTVLAEKLRAAAASTPKTAPAGKAAPAAKTTKAKEK
jgi:large subunit ribosomal protein L29